MRIVVAPDSDSMASAQVMLLLQHSYMVDPDEDLRLSPVSPFWVGTLCTPFWMALHSAIL